LDARQRATLDPMSGTPERAEEEETRGGALPDVIHLPDQSQPPRKRPVPWRGRPRVADPLSARFDVRCTPEFLAELSARATAAGLSLSAYVCAALGDEDGRRGRRRTAALPQIDRTLLAQLLAQIGKFGSNHNQLAYEKNTTGAGPELDEWRRIAAGILDLRRMAMKALGYGD
jgi:hypothetical protein